jgi:hypothetical protein
MIWHAISIFLTSLSYFCYDRSLWIGGELDSSLDKLVQLCRFSLANTALFDFSI